MLLPFENEKKNFRYLIRFWSCVGEDLPYEHPCLAHILMHIWMYRHKYPSKMHKTWFLGGFKVKEFKSAV